MIVKDFTIKLKNCYVYLHILKQSGEVFYVGKGTKYRWSSTYRSKQWFNKVGIEEVICKIVANNLTDNEAFLLERKIIESIGRDNLVNLTDGGEGCNGSIVSKETRLRISTANSLNVNERTDHLRRKIIMNDSICFYGVKEAARYLNDSNSNHISRVANGKSLSHKGNLFRWATMGNAEFHLMQNELKLSIKNKLSTGAINARSNDLKTRVKMDEHLSFQSVLLASEYLVDMKLAKNIKSAKSTINANLRKETKTAFGYSWTKYLENKG